MSPPRIGRRCILSSTTSTAEVGSDVVVQVARTPSVFQLARAQQVLHAVWIAVTGRLGDGPAVLPRQIRKQPREGTLGRAGGSPHGRTGRPSDRATGRSPLSTTLALRCGPRPPLDHQMSPRTIIKRWPVPRPDRHAGKITIYGWSTR
jgi:hypothetical protein